MSVPVPINLDGFCEPSKKVLTIQDEFFGVYCLKSRSENPLYRNKCYVGYTVDPNRRVVQHNGGRQAGGANKTNNRGPWDMVCIIHGFPNSISALRFEWAWQNPHKSKRLKDLFIQKKQNNESHFDFKFRTVCTMLTVDPWKRLGLSFRWLLPEFERPFPVELPKHMKIKRGLVKKTKTLVPRELSNYTTVEDCTVCGNRIKELTDYVECLSETCRVQYHIQCLCELGLKQTDRFQIQLFPLISTCIICKKAALWSDMVRRQRCLIEINNAKPTQNNFRIADGMIPVKIEKA